MGPTDEAAQIQGQAGLPAHNDAGKGLSAQVRGSSKGRGAGGQSRGGAEGLLRFELDFKWL